MDNWIDERYPVGRTLFGKPNFFENVRKKARKEIRIPETYPLLNKIESDPNGGFWILRAYYRDSGQVWSYISSDGKLEYTVTFPGGREILLFGERYIIARHKDKDGVELLELYSRRPISE